MKEVKIKKFLKNLIIIALIIILCFVIVSKFYYRTNLIKIGGIGTLIVVTGSMDPTIKSNESPISGTRKTNNIGLAVFKDDKLTGELNAIETICFLNMRKEVDSFLVSVSDPQDSNSKIDIYLTPNNTHNIDVSFVNGAPYVKIKLEFSGKIYSMSRNSEYLDTNFLISISNSCDNYLEYQFSSYLYKTSTVFESDINAIGSYALSKFITTTEFDDYNWLDNYKNSTFDVEINTVMDSGFLLTQT